MKVESILIKSDEEGQKSVEIFGRFFGRKLIFLHRHLPTTDNQFFVNKKAQFVLQPPSTFLFVFFCNGFIVDQILVINGPKVTNTLAGFFKISNSPYTTPIECADQSQCITVASRRLQPKSNKRISLSSKNISAKNK